MRVLLIRLSALGDIVHTWPVAETIRAKRPDIHLAWIVERPLAPLVEGHPAVDAVITARTRRWRQRPWSSQVRSEMATCRTRLHELRPGLTIDPQGTVKSAIIAHWSGAERTVGLARPWRREWLAGMAYSETVAGAAAGKHVVDTNLAMLRALDLEPPETTAPDGSWLRDAVSQQRPIGPWHEPYAVVLPGVGGAHKTLPIATLGAVCRGIDEFGLQPVVLWGPGEEVRATAVVRAGGARTRLAPPTDIRQMAAVLGGARLVIGGDTGPLHLAAALAVPTVGVFLASDWRRNGPLGPATTVVSGAAEAPPKISGRARRRPEREVEAGEILESARRLVS